MCLYVCVCCKRSVCTCVRSRVPGAWMILQCDVTMLLSVWRLLITAQPFFLCPASWPYDTMRFFRVLPDGDGFAPEHSDSGVFFLSLFFTPWTDELEEEKTQHREEYELVRTIWQEAVRLVGHRHECACSRSVCGGSAAISDRRPDMLCRPTPTYIIHVLARNVKAEKHYCWAGLYFRAPDSFGAKATQCMQWRGIEQGPERYKKSPREFPAGFVNIVEQRPDLLGPARSA
jgi:hypothetical protein